LTTRPKKRNVDLKELTPFGPRSLLKYRPSARGGFKIAPSIFERVGHSSLPGPASLLPSFRRSWRSSNNYSRRRDSGRSRSSTPTVIALSSAVGNR